MIIHENEELLMTDLISDITKYIETNNTDFLDSFRDKLSFIIENTSNEFIDYIFALLEDSDYNDEYGCFFENQLRDIVEFKEDNGKQHVLIAIPLLIIGYSSTTDLEYVRKRKSFDSRLFKLHVDLEYILNKKLKTKYQAKLKLHNSFSDMSQLFHKYQETNKLKTEFYLSDNERPTNSILSKNIIEKYDTDKKDGLKFILGIIEFDPKEDLHEVFNNSFNYIEQDYETLNARFKDLLINQQVSAEEVILMPPAPITSAIDEGWSKFHYQILLNLISNSLKYKQRSEIMGHIIYTDETIYVLFFDVNAPEIPFYRIEVKHGVYDFEEEIELITDIFIHMNLKYAVIRT